MFSRLLFIFLLLISTGLATHLSAADQVYDVIGVIRAPLDSNGQVVIAHEAIAGLMPAMTMAFPVANPADAARLHLGDRVQFRLHVGPTSSTADDFIVSGNETPIVPTKVPIAGNAARPRLKEGDRVPEFSLKTEQSGKISSADFQGRFTLLTFIFTRCPIPEYCPAMALRFGKIQKEILARPALAGRVRLLSITLDPEFDRPEILKAYGRAVGANPAVWAFATGEKEQIAALAKSFAVFSERNGAVLNHTLCTALVGSDGRIIELWRGNGWSAEEALEAVAAANGTP